MGPTTNHQQQQQQLKSKEFLRSLSEFFKRDLISIPLVEKYQHQIFNQRCDLKAATLELDTSSYPNIEYIAGNRLSVYPINPSDHVNVIMKHLIDDLNPKHLTQAAAAAATSPKSNIDHGATAAAASASEQANNKKKQPKNVANTTNNNNNNSSTLETQWANLIQLHGRDSLRVALTYIYDITTAPSRDLLRIMAENCSNKDHKTKLISICTTDESWESWICSSLRSLKTTFEEFSSCTLSARALFSELILQQPRQYSISSIKSSKRFRSEIIVFQHKFTQRHISNALQNIKEREKTALLQTTTTKPQPLQPTVANNKVLAHINVEGKSASFSRSISGLRSLRSVVDIGGMTSPITAQQVKRVYPYSGPLMSLYAGLGGAESRQSLGSSPGAESAVGGAGGGKSASTGHKSLLSQANQDTASHHTAAMYGKLYEGLCSSYLLNLSTNDHIICEFVENPCFTLKGNRERPIMMIGQDVGMVAYRAFWQQRTLEHDRAQIFYTLFKDLAPKKFGEMQLVSLTGNRCKIEDLFKKEISSAMRNKVLSSVININRDHLLALLDSAATSSLAQLVAATGAQKKMKPSHGQTVSPPSSTGGNSTNSLVIESKELLDLGQRIAKLLIENNGCLYTCCDYQMTQALEILTVESVAKLSGMSKDKVMGLLPRWKGRRLEDSQQPVVNNKFLYTLENAFERAQIVQEIYDSSV